MASKFQPCGNSVPLANPTAPFFGSRNINSYSVNLSLSKMESECYTFHIGK